MINRFKYIKQGYLQWFLLTVVAVFICSFVYLFYMQVQEKTTYISDMEAHIYFIKYPKVSEASSYSIIHQLMTLGDRLLKRTALTNRIGYALLSLLVFATLLGYYVSYRAFNNAYRQPVKAIVGALCVCLVSMIIMEWPSNKVYVGVWSPNPWHNPTYIFAKPFVLLTFVLSISFIDKIFIDKKSNFRNAILLALFVLIGTWAKPSFYISFLPAIAILVCVRWWQKKLDWQQVCLIAICMMPAVLVMWGISKAVYQTDSATNTLIISLAEAWKMHTKQIGLAVISAGAFPLFVVAMHIRKLPTMLLLAFINYVIAFLVFYCLAESGNRMVHANFGWTYMFALFILFFACIQHFLFKWQASKPMYYIAMLLLVLHLYSGLQYFSKIVCGGEYF